MLHFNTMGKLRLALGALFVASLYVASCSKPVDTSATSQYIGVWNGTTSCGEGLGGWTAKAPIYANGRKGAFSFSVNAYDSTIYVGGGLANTDFWNYNPATNAWSQQANIPGVLRFRSYATGFGIDDRGYMVCGADSGFYKNDLWQYDPSTNTWNPKAAFPGKPRIKAFSFVDRGIAYVGGGIDTGGAELTDFYAYYPGNDQWIQRPDVPRSVVSPFSFSINKRGYISCGSQNGTEDTATFCFDSSANVWTRVAGFPGHPRQGGASFAVHNLGYCGLGSYLGTTAFEDFYYYNPPLNKWSKQGDYPGRFNASPMYGVAHNKGYVGMGSNGTSSLYTYWYEFTPPSNSAHFTISAGTNNYTVIMAYSVGKDSCQIDVNLTGTVSSTNIGKEAFSIGTHNVVDRCGRNYSVTGSGSLNGDVITITTVSSSSLGTSACTFTGRR